MPRVKTLGCLFWSRPSRLRRSGSSPVLAPSAARVRGIRRLRISSNGAEHSSVSPGSLAKAATAYPFKVQILEWQQWADLGVGVDSLELPGASRELAYSRPVSSRVETEIYRAMPDGDVVAVVRSVDDMSVIRMPFSPTPLL